MSSSAVVMDVQSMTSTQESARTLANRSFQEDMTPWGWKIGSSSHNMTNLPVQRRTSGFRQDKHEVPRGILDLLQSIIKVYEQRSAEELRRHSETIFQLSAPPDLLATDFSGALEKWMLVSPFASWKSTPWLFPEFSQKESTLPLLEIEQEDAREWDENPLTPQDVLEQLQNPDIPHTDRRQLIIEAEGLDFDVDESTVLIPLLFEFIMKYRDSNNPEDLLAAGSAIRNYVALLPLTDVGTVATLLEPGHQTVLPLEIQLEIAKMVARKFTANPPHQVEPEPELANHLAGLAKAYMEPHILPREKYAAVTVNALLALAAMRSKRMDALLKPLNETPYTWFRYFFTQQLMQIIEEWRIRCVDVKQSENVAELESLLRRMVPATI